jgi:hypothetical protein
MCVVHRHTIVWPTNAPQSRCASVKRSVATLDFQEVLTSVNGLAHDVKARNSASWECASTSGMWALHKEKLGEPHDTHVRHRQSFLHRTHLYHLPEEVGFSKVFLSFQVGEKRVGACDISCTPPHQVLVLTLSSSLQLPRS